jgi:hypothetical protein
MSDTEQWKQQKLKNLECLRACIFTFANYSPPSADWDHDHCRGCMAKFALFDAPEILRSGYFTRIRFGDESIVEPEIIRQARESGREVLAKPDAKEWVCPDCFQAFRETLAWKLAPQGQA